MRNESNSLRHIAEFCEDKESIDSLSASTSLLQQLGQDNARLRKIVSQLLYKNQMLRWQLSGQRSFNMQPSSMIENEREG